MRRGTCIYCGLSVALKKDGTLKKHRHNSKDCPGSNHEPEGVEAIRAFIASHRTLWLNAENTELKTVHYEIAEKTAARHHDLLKESPDEIDLTPYFKKKLGEHFKTTQRVINDETREFEWRAFDLEVIATEEEGVWFQVWSFSFGHFYDEGEYYDCINHGVSYVSLVSCGSPLGAFHRATDRYICRSTCSLKRNFTKKPYLGHK